MQIRVAEPDEYAAVGELTARVYTEEGFVRPGSPYVAELADAAARADKAELLVAVTDRGDVVGSVTFANGGTAYAETAAEGEAAFRMLVVDRAARGSGVGGALVGACIDRARATGARTLRLSTQPNMRAAHRLYRRFGFVRTPERDWSPGHGENLITFELDLG